jgi:hypothetical protein
MGKRNYRMKTRSPLAGRQSCFLKRPGLLCEIRLPIAQRDDAQLLQVI